MTMTMTYGQIETSLQAAIAATIADDDDDTYVYVCDFSDTYVIYCKNWDEYLQQDYSMDDDGNVTLSGEPEPVKPFTTYVPIEQEAAAKSAFQQRGLRMGAAPRQQRRLTPHVRVRSEPLTYHRQGRDSYYRDFILTGLGRHSQAPGAEDRLRRHGMEMDVLAKERNEQAWRSFRSGAFEYRVEPNTTQGQGGYFDPPAWLNELFATARRPGRVLSGLAPHFPLPGGVQSINLPLLSTGTQVTNSQEISAVPDQDITDALGSSDVVTFSGDADVALQLLEQSPQGAHLDWALFTDMAESYDYSLETQLLYGLGTFAQQLPGVVPNASVSVAYNDSSPTGAEMWTALAQAGAQLGDSRDLPLEIWLMRTARWFWIQGSESTNGYPFGISPMFLGAGDDSTPYPIGGIMGAPVFLDDALSPTTGAGGNQDIVVAIRPSDLIVFEGTPRTSVMLDPLSGGLGVRIQMHNYAAAITRYTSGIAVVAGTGFVVQSGY